MSGPGRRGGRVEVMRRRRKGRGERRVLACRVGRAQEKRAERPEWGGCPAKGGVVAKEARCCCTSPSGDQLRCVVGAARRQKTAKTRAAEQRTRREKGGNQVCRKPELKKKLAAKKAQAGIALGWVGQPSWQMSSLHWGAESQKP